MVHRTFLALDIDDTVRRRLAALRRRLDVGGKINWVAPPNLHVTMKFLGDCDDVQLADVCAAAAEVAGGQTAFDFDVRGVITIPPRGPLRMIWAGASDANGNLAQLSGQIDSAMAPLGFDSEKRAFRGHITLARIRHTNTPRVLRAAAAVGDELFGTVRAEHLAVITSTLTPQGPAYTPAAKLEFGKSG